MRGICDVYNIPQDMHTVLLYIVLFWLYHSFLIKLWNIVYKLPNHTVHPKDYAPRPHFVAIATEPLKNTGK